MEYGYPERRKTRSDKRAKARYMRYKKGGTFRSTEIKEGQGQEKKND